MKFSTQEAALIAPLPLNKVVTQSSNSSSHDILYMQNQLDLLFIMCDSVEISTAADWPKWYYTTAHVFKIWDWYYSSAKDLWSLEVL